MRRSVVIRALTQCINSYQGQYGRVLPVLSNVVEYKVDHVEWTFGYHYSTLYITFRGSDGKQDWCDNIKGWTKEVPYQTTNPNIKVHAGFISQYKKARNLLRVVLDKDIVEGKCNSIIVTGHSLGGALATICALDLQFNDHNDMEIECITFGSPRVGNRAFAHSYNLRVPVTYRLVYGHDTVCKVPPKILGYEHVGTRILVDRKKWWWYIVHPILTIFGNPLDHRPEKYLEGVQSMKM